MNNLSPRGLKRIPVGLPGVGWPQLATYPQSPFSGPASCCDVAYLSQAFSQRTGPGRLWISLGAYLWFVWISRGGPNPPIDTDNLHTPTNPKTCNLQSQECYPCIEPKVLPMF